MIKRIVQDKFVRDNAVFLMGSIAVAVINYLYHPVMSRMMSVSDFGEVQALISLMYITSIIMIIFGTIAVNIVTNRKEDSDEHIKILSQLYKLAFIIVGVFAIGIVVLSPFLMRVLQFESAVSFWPLAALLIIGVPYVFYVSYLRGMKRFGTVSIAGVIASGGKLLFAVILVTLGLQVFGAVSGIALASLCALGYVIYRTHGQFQISLKEKLSFSPVLRKELSYGILILFSLGYITFLYTSDVLVVKYFFDPETAGLYSGIATIARIIFFATASVAGVVLSTIKIKASYEQNSRTMKKALVIVTLMGGAALSLFFFFPTVIISLLIGEKYLPLAELLPIAGLYIFAVSLANLLFVYFLALRDRRLIIISLIGFFAIIALIVLHHDSLQAIVIDYIIGAVVTIGMIGVSILWKPRKRINNE